MLPSRSSVHAGLKSSQSVQSKAGRSKLSLRNRRGKTKKEARLAQPKSSGKNPDTTCCSNSEESSSQPGAGEKVLRNQNEEAKENFHENLLSNEGHCVTLNEGSVPPATKESFLHNIGKDDHSNGKDECRRKDQGKSCSQTQELKLDATSATMTKSRKKRKVPIPSFSPLARAEGNSLSQVQSVPKNGASSNHSVMKNDGLDERSNFSDSFDQNIIRSKYFVTEGSKIAAESEAKKMAFVDREGLDCVKHDSDSDSDLPSPVFSSSVKQVNVDGLREKPFAKNYGVSLPGNCASDHCKLGSKDNITTVGDTSSICVIELDESSCEHLDEGAVIKPSDGCLLDSELHNEKPRLASKIRNRAVKSPDEEDLFEIPVAKKIADRERELDTRQSDLLRMLSKKASHPEERRKRGFSHNGSDERIMRSKKQVCALCSTCSCSRGAALKGLEQDATEEANNPLRGLARSDAEVEKALVSRLKRLEKSSSWFNHLSHKVGRELRRHRSKVMSKNVEQFAAARLDQPRFLADAEHGSPELELPPQSRFSEVQVRKVQGKFLGSRKGYQPTLTQLIPGERIDVPSEKSSEKTLEIGKTEGGSTFDSSLGEVHLENKTYSPLERSFLENSGEIHQEGTLTAGVEASHNQENMDTFQTASERSLERLSKDSRHPEKSIGLWRSTACGKESKKAYCANKNQKEDQACSPATEGYTNKEIGFPVDHSERQGGFDYLLHLIHSPEEPEINSAQALVPSAAKTDSQCSKGDNETSDDFSRLTHHGQIIFARIQEDVEKHPEKLAAIQKLCPQWKDNVQFSLMQNDESAVREALTNVERSRQSIAETKRRLEEQDHCLELYELALQKSLNQFAMSK